MNTFAQFKKKTLRNKEVKKAYDALGPQFELIEAIIRKRIQKKLTQAELASRLGTHQSAIARLESGSENPTLSYLNEIAHAVGGKLHVSIV
ncbi:MAG: helix-turn-helix domain-containing protein [Candidatus Paceibacterota bacterium]|jgi:DNA-binding XRE family transcriptional regulator